MPSGAALGTLCLIDRHPRTLDAMELGILATLRDLAVLELRELSGQEAAREDADA
jgi:hypothetical protein